MKKQKIISRLLVVIVVLALILFIKKVYDQKTYPQRLEQSYQKQRVTKVLSDVYHVDAIYKSMKGPKGTKNVYLLDSKIPELLWITGFETMMVDQDGERAMPPEFMCHTNLDFGPRHKYKYDHENSRLFTLSQGQLATVFPKGFAMPIMSNDPLKLITQVLNLNNENENVFLRHNVKIHYIRDRDLSIKMKPLFMAGAQGMKGVKRTLGGYEDLTDASICFTPRRLVRFNAAENLIVDEEKGKFRAHWTVKPGKEIVRTDVTDMLQIPYDTTAHYIAVHLHPFAQSLELRDLTLDRTIYKSNATNYEDRIGLSHVENFSSSTGIKFYKNHRYEIISHYNNTTQEDLDSMAVMFIYLLSKD